MSVLEAATVDGEVIDWADLTGPYGEDLDYRLLYGLMERCLQGDPAHRPSLSEVQTLLCSVNPA